MVRVRFAPSPTGYLHIGSARTALFNWLYARHCNGEFILRIEDTDKERSKAEYLDEIMASLRWLGMAWNGEPFFQSQRFAIYREHADTLLAAGAAYRDGAAIIFRVTKDQTVSFDDMIHGTITVSTNEIKDQVLIKSDGTPTYNFACVIDDALMQITHVIRGDDHISNTPKQVLLYRALGWELPHYAHIPLILSKDGGRLSKRHGATSIFEYKNMGFVAEALVNYLALMGWAPGNDREILPAEELIKLFDVKDVNKTGAIFDMDKLSWMNGQYIMAMASDKLAALVSEKIAAAGHTADTTMLRKAIDLYRIRAKTLAEFVTLTDYFFTDAYTIDEKGKAKHLDGPENKAIVRDFRERLARMDDFSHASLEAACRAMADEKKLKAGAIIHPTRMAVSGKTSGAGLFEIMEALGKETVLARMQKASV